MRAIYLTIQGSKINKEHQRIVIRKNKEILGKFPIREVKRLILLGNIQLTTQVMRMLMDHGVDVSFLSTRGRLQGRLVSPHSLDGPLQIAQVQALNSPDYRLLFSQIIVEHKIVSQRRIISRHLRNHPNPALSEALQQLERLQTRISNTKDIASVMGLEGACGRHYFQVFSHLLRNQNFTFEDRNRRPPRDPVNAMLSLGYSLLTRELAHLLEANGINPFLGLLHGLRKGRDSLALDLIEEFRAPVVDRFILSLLNLQQFHPDDFHHSTQHGVQLHEDSLRRFLRFWEERMEAPIAEHGKTLRESFRFQVAELEDAILKHRPYLPSFFPD